MGDEKRVKGSHKLVIVSLPRTNKDRKDVQIHNGKSNTSYEVQAIPCLLRTEIWYILSLAQVRLLTLFRLLLAVKVRRSEGVAKRVH